MGVRAQRGGASVGGARTHTPQLRDKINSTPFTLEHFRNWASEVVLDTDEPWILEPFQEAFVEDLFSGKAACWLVIPEGNGKTTLIAGLGLYHCEFMPHATVLAAAAAVEQANVIYQQAEGMVLRTPRLTEKVQSAMLIAKGKRTTEAPRFDCLEGFKRINHAGGSRLQVKAAADATGDGVIPTLALVDELHRHRNLALYRTWLGKLRKRGGQLIVISTAGEPGGEFETTREGMRANATEIERTETFVRAASQTWVLHDWALPEDADVEDFAFVARANPLSLVTAESLEEKYGLPGMTPQHWRRFTCNLPTRPILAAITEYEWDGAITKEQIPEGVPISAGLDLGWKQDCTALVPLWLKSDEFRIFGDPVVLEPPRDGSSLKPELVERAIIEMNARNPLELVVMDTTAGEQLASWISTEIGATVIDRSQGSALQSEDYARFMEALRSGWLKHTGSRVLRQHALNASSKMNPDGRVRFVRQTSARGSTTQEAVRSIDALVAAAMVHCEVTSPRDEVWYGL